MSEFTIHKYRLLRWRDFYPENPRIRIHLPSGAQSLCVAAQDDFVSLWARVRPAAPLVQRDYYARLTGRLFEESFERYLGTVFWETIVAHVFEVPEL